MRTLAAIVVALVLSGCAVASGTKITDGELSALKQKNASVEQVIAQFGQPASSSTLPDGSKMLSYSYSETNLIGNQFPGKMAFAHLRFSKDGKLVSFQTNDMNTRQPNQRILY